MKSVFCKVKKVLLDRKCFFKLTKIDMSNSFYTGIISPSSEFGGLTTVKIIDLSNTDFSKC